MNDITNKGGKRRCCHLLPPLAGGPFYHSLYMQANIYFINTM